MPRTMRGVRVLRLVLLVVLSLPALTAFEEVENRNTMGLIVILCTLVAQKVLDRFDRHFIDGFTMRRR